MPKVKARSEAREIRRAIPPEVRAEKSERIREHVMALPEMARARAVACYVSVGSEVQTDLLLRALLAKGIVVAVPVMDGDHMSFARLDHPWALVAGPRGIPEPREPCTPVDGETLDIIMIPGLRFGRDGSRLGMGGGHFDRYLAAHPRALRVGLAFSEQVMEKVPDEEHDEGMDVVVTEEGRLRVGRGNKA